MGVTRMKCIIDGIDFYDLPAMKYFSPSTSWSPEKKKENAMQKIFSGEWWGAQKRDGIFVMRYFYDLAQRIRKASS